VRRRQRIARRKPRASPARVINSSGRSRSKKHSYVSIHFRAHSVAECVTPPHATSRLLARKNVVFEGITGAVLELSVVSLELAQGLLRGRHVVS
jgi:hypothetical protein